jgi:hypothetical protein
MTDVTETAAPSEGRGRLELDELRARAQSGEIETVVCRCPICGGAWWASG